LLSYFPLHNGLLILNAIFLALLILLLRKLRLVSFGHSFLHLLPCIWRRRLTIIFVPCGLNKPIICHNFLASVLLTIIILNADIIKFVLIFDGNPQINMAAINMFVVFTIAGYFHGHLSIQLLSHYGNILDLIDPLFVTALASAFVFYPHQHCYMKKQAQKQHAQADQWCDDVL